jgi:AraC-like DNA-binding protein
MRALWAPHRRAGYPDSDSGDSDGGRAVDTSARDAKNARMLAFADALAYRTRSLDAAREHVAGVFAAHRLACGTRELDFVHQRRDRPRASLNRLRYGAEVIVDAPALERFYLLQCTLAGHCEIELGRRTVALGAGAVLVVNPTRPYRKRWSADCTQLIARLDRELVEEAWTARHGNAPRQPLEFAFAQLPAVASAPLAAALLAADRGVLSGRALADALVAVLPPAERERHTAASDVLVRWAEAFIAAHLGTDLSVADIAQAAGTTARTLERAFRRAHDATVVARLRTLRLERARVELVAARRDGRSVTDVATALGLLHAGRFAVDYRRQFGESPSQTLRGRAPAPGRGAAA